MLSWETYFIQRGKLSSVDEELSDDCHKQTSVTHLMHKQLQSNTKQKTKKKAFVKLKSIFVNFVTEVFS